MRETHSTPSTSVQTLDLFSWIGGAVGQLSSILDVQLFMQVAAEFAQSPITASRFFLPLPDTPTAWREIANKIGVYLLVRESSRILQLEPGQPFSLEQAVGRAYAIAPYQALWALEGLGHEYVEHARTCSVSLVDLLRGSNVQSLPPGSLLMLHAGIGLAFAQHELEAVVAQGGDLERAVQNTITLCRENSTNGYTGAALESLGLVTRTFHPTLVRRVDAVLGQIDPAVTPYFWHGVGRAIYFLPVNFVPCGHVASRALRMVRQEAAYDLAYKNAMAGFAWAFTLVNMQHPEMVADLVKRQRACLAANDAFANGVASTMAMRQDTTTDAAFISAFLAYQPGRDVAADWARIVRQPAERGVSAQPELRRTGSLDRIFRYQPGEAGGIQGTWQGRA